MGKNIVVITGSARKKGNSNLLAEAFIKGAGAAGHNVSRFDSAEDVIEGCKGCDACWSKGKPCSFDDGFDKLAPLLEKADTLVLCGPVYWYTFNTYLKAAIDKLYAYMAPQCKTKLPIKETFLMMCAEEKDEAVFKHAVGAYKTSVKLVGWEDRGTLLAPGVNKKGDIEGHPALAQAEKMGKEI